MDYDTRFKLLLTLFFQEFVELFLPDFAQRVDWRKQVEFLDKELQDILPQRTPGAVDLLAKVAAKKPLRRGRGERLCLIHVEIESRKSRRAMGERMFDYFHRIRRKFGIPVVPSVLYVRVGEGLGWQSLHLYSLEHCFCHFEFPCIGLPALD